MSLEHDPQRQRRPGIGHNSGLREYNRFADLQTAGIFRSRMTCDRAIKRGDFPPGRLLGAIRIWTRGEIEAALAKCPTTKRASADDDEPSDEEDACTKKRGVRLRRAAL
jgi:predicted DNA-binding transcriptional regulator AlpA